jgi:hypothetical protein
MPTGRKRQDGWPPSPTISRSTTAAAVCLPPGSTRGFDDVKNEYYAAFGEVAADSMIDMSAVIAARPALGEFGVEEEDGAEKAEAEASEDWSRAMGSTAGQRQRV